jgi:alkylation response protein AidB-like acyl-CoA dehydrogenase
MRSNSPEFFQDGPRLGNQYDDDGVLRAYLKRRLPSAVLAGIEPDLRAMGGRAAGDLLELARAAEAQPPRHVPYDPWGRRVDRIEVSPAWNELDRVAAREGLIAIGYERKHGEWSRTYQLAKLFLFHPSSAIYSCPLAMTDGAARAIELYGDSSLREGAYSRLTSRDPSRFWTSGQWMTERTGGSDVGGTSTVARLEGGEYRLNGTKSVTSATTSQMAMTLARVEGDEAGSRGLSLFYLELRDASGVLNGIEVHRLKDKLGTKALPTAELTLDGARARLVGGQGQGVKKISSLFNITRIYNSVCAVGYIRRGLALARDYADRRRAFGAPLSAQPLHLETLAELEVEYRAAFHLTFRLIELLGREETAQATAAESALLRLLTPVAKLFTAKQAVRCASETLECFGGAGYVEDTGLPGLLRDAQVLSIWEGTTNVLSLDVLRAVEKEGAFAPFMSELRERVREVGAAELTESARRVIEAGARVEAFLAQRDPSAVVSGAREFAFALARVYAGALLLEQAQWELGQAKGSPQAVLPSVAAARRWCARELAPPISSDATHREESRGLALGSGALDFSCPVSGSG